jgi:hypothetical protein
LLENGLRGEQEFEGNLLKASEASRDSRDWPATREEEVEDVETEVEDISARKNERMGCSG